jgi:hypothetical protein
LSAFFEVKTGELQMAVTRIKNNQITDATIVASSKLVDYSISAAKIANNLTYGSNLTVTGNLTVQGNTTAIDTNITTIEDPVILLASTQTGAPAVDIGFLGQRGTANNIAFVWDESQSTFVTAFSDTAETATTINILAYANLKVLNANVTAGLTVAGQSNIANLTVAANSIVSFGNVVISNVADPVANTDAATKAYVLSTLGNSSFAISDGTTTEAVNGGDTIDFDGTTDQITVAVASVTGNVSSVTVALANNVSVVANVTVGNILAVTGTVNSNLVPTTTATYNLGAAGALEAAAAILEESPIPSMVAERYASYDAGKGKVLAASQPFVCVLNAGELLVTQAAAPASLTRVPFSNEFE